MKDKDLAWCPKCGNRSLHFIDDAPGVNERIQCHVCDELFDKNERDELWSRATPFRTKTCPKCNGSGIEHYTNGPEHQPRGAQRCRRCNGARQIVYQTGTNARDYILHIVKRKGTPGRPGVTFCGRETSSVNCHGGGEKLEHDAIENPESLCRICLKKFTRNPSSEDPQPSAAARDYTIAAKPGTWRVELDVNKLDKAVKDALAHRKLSARDLARAVGVAPSTLSRLTRGHSPSADALLSLCGWLGVEASAFARRAQPKERKRRKHSRSGNLHCDICAPLRCELAP